MSAIVIFNGSSVKTLKAALKLGNSATIHSGSLDPSVDGFIANDGDIYISTSTKKIYQKNGGSSTDWDATVTSGTFEAYSSEFNNTSDWGSESGGFYTISVLQATHLKGVNPLIQTFELVGSDYILNNVDQVIINGSGDVSIKVPSSPDLRFNGKLLVI